jgi:hypothetical protein
MTWLDIFDRFAASHSDTLSEDEGDSAGELLEALFDRYRAEGYPGVHSQLPADMLLQ